MNYAYGSVYYGYVFVNAEYFGVNACDVGADISKVSLYCYNVAFNAGYFSINCCYVCFYYADV